MTKITGKTTVLPGKNRPVHPDFMRLLACKSPELVELFLELRAFVLDIYPQCNEMLYHTHALTAVFSLSEKLADAYCTIPVYTNHLNLAFNRATRLPDPDALLKGTGNLMRHIPVRVAADFRTEAVTALVRAAVNFSLNDCEGLITSHGLTISKINIK